MGNRDSGTFGTGSHLTIAGFDFQILAHLIFGALCVEFACKIHKNRVFIEPSTESIQFRKRFRYFFAVLIFAYICIFFSCIYEIVTLASGLGGLITDGKLGFLVFADLSVSHF